MVVTNETEQGRQYKEYAIKPKEALSYSVESSGTNSAVPQPVWKAALVLPFVSILPSRFPGLVLIYSSTSQCRNPISLAFS